MFHWSKEDLSVENAKAPEKYQKRGDRGNGGWTTRRSHDGLVRRILHAIMTQDTFTVVSKYAHKAERLPHLKELYSALTLFSLFLSPNRLVGGHSAAAGQG